MGGTDDPDKNKPSPAQLRSQKTVLRLQLIADQLRDDLKEAGLTGIRELFFVQRFWKDGNEFILPPEHEVDSTLVYVANCCATWQFAEKHLEELRTAATTQGADKPGAMKHDSLQALFSASRDSFSDFAAKISANNGDPTAAHDLLIDAASALPFQGQLPSVAENLLNDNLGIWFRSKENGKFCYTPLDSVAKVEPAWKDLDGSVHKEAVFLGSPEANQSKLRAAFDTFLNPFLLGRRPNEDASKCCYPAESNVDSLMLVLPCYQIWTIGAGGKEVRCGAFLGWVFLVLGRIENGENPATKLVEPNGETAATKHGTNGAISESHLNLLRLCFNHFAERVQDALLVECIREYADDQAEITPSNAFKEYFQRVEGWYCDDEAETSLAVSDSPEENFKVKKKEWTQLGDWGAANFPPTTIGRSVRLWRALCAFYGAKESETLKKYKQMLEALTIPLNGVTGALADLQRDTQEIRAVLYDPAKALFESSPRLKDLFEPGQLIHVSRHISVEVSHNPTTYEKTGSWTEDQRGDGCKSVQTGWMVLWVALCRIFGVDDRLENAASFEDLAYTVGSILTPVARNRAFKELWRDVFWLTELADPEMDPTSALSEILKLKDEFGNASKMRTAIGNLKQALFTPFKIDAKKWSSLALVLAIRPYLKNPHHDFSSLKVPKWKSLSGMSAASPVNYACVLDFLIGIALSDDSRKVVELRFCENGSRSIELDYSKPFWTGADETAKIQSKKDLKSLLNVILEGIRDWRLVGGNVGDWQGPFIELANRAIGVVPRSALAQGWVAQETEKDVAIQLGHSDGKRAFSVEVSDARETGTIKLTWTTE